MIIRKKRIRSIGKNIQGINLGDMIIVGLRDIERFTQRLTQLGFSTTLEVGESILPAGIGPISVFNADGGNKIHKDQPMETAYRMGEWSWEQFRGRYDKEQKSKIVDIPYKRYPRTFILPPSIELSIKNLKNGGKILSSPEIEFTPSNDNDLIHIINLYLECFGECEIFRQDLNPIVSSKIIRLNWKILPPGEMPWPQLREKLEPIINRQPEGNRVVINARIETINRHNPEFVAIGQGGFDGYTIFGFPAKSLFVLESTQINNATYVLDRDWEDLSSKTKAELLNNDLHKERIIHRKNWFREINKLLK